MEITPLSTEAQEHLALMDKFYPFEENLMSDFSLHEEFLVCGDSLFMHILSIGEQKLDSAFETVRFIFFLEKYLNEFRKRSGKFRIFFFKRMESMWATLERALAEIHGLTFSLVSLRRLVQEHLKRNVSFEVILDIESWQDPRFRSYLESIRPGFVLLSDGEFNLHPFSVLGGEQLIPFSYVFRSLALYIVVESFKVSYMEHVSFNANIVNGFMVSEKYEDEFSDTSEASAEVYNGIISEFDANMSENPVVKFEELIDGSIDELRALFEGGSDDPYVKLTQVAVHVLLLDSKLEDIATHCQVILVVAHLLSNLGLMERALQIPEGIALSDKELGFLYKFSAAFGALLRKEFLQKELSKEYNNALSNFFSAKLFLLLSRMRDTKEEAPKIEWEIPEMVLSAWKKLEDRFSAGELEIAFQKLPNLLKSEQSGARPIFYPVESEFLRRCDAEVFCDLPPVDGIDDKLAGFSSSLENFSENYEYFHGQDLSTTRKENTGTKSEQDYYKFQQTMGTSLKGSTMVYRKRIITRTPEELKQEREKKRKETEKTKRDAEGKGGKKGKKGQKQKKGGAMSKEDMIRENMQKKIQQKVEADKVKVTYVVEDVSKTRKSAAKKLVDFQSRLSKNYRGDAPDVLIIGYAYLIELYKEIIDDMDDDISTLDSFDHKTTEMVVGLLDTIHKVMDLPTEVIRKNKKNISGIPDLLTMLRFYAAASRARTIIEGPKKPSKSKYGFDDDEDRGGRKRKGKGKGKKGRSRRFEEEPVVDVEEAPEEEQMGEKREGERSLTEFNLENMGHLFRKHTRSVQDDRTEDFDPDEWQRDLLDVVDANESALVIAPTSSGKTFISFYCMQKVLTESDEKVVIYVCPTRALVNQASVDVYTSFQKTYKGGTVLYGVYLNYVRNPFNCQILITSPEYLHELLISYKNKKWSKRIAYVIFDEVHMIGDDKQGHFWERTLLMINSPFLALSATIGNPTRLEKWLTSSVRETAPRVHLINHDKRYVDLHTYIYLPNSDTSYFYDMKKLEGVFEETHSEFEDVREKAKGKLAAYKHAGYLSGLTKDRAKLDDEKRRILTEHLSWRDDVPSKRAVFQLHPLTFMPPSILKRDGFQKDLHLIPSSCLELYNAMASVCEKTGNEWELREELLPENYFKVTADKVQLITQESGHEYEGKIKEELMKWVTTGREELVDAVLHSVSSVKGEIQEWLFKEWKVKQHHSPYATKEFMLKSIFSLLKELKARDFLPALVFNFNRVLVEQFAETLYEHLEAIETLRFEQKDKDEKKNEKIKAKKAKVRKRMRDELEKQAEQKKPKTAAELEFEQGEEEDEMELELPPEDSFIPVGIQDDIEEIISKVMKKEIIDKKFLNYLKRGIGIHHPGLGKKYRQTVEYLFRMKYLAVVFTTDTLALGIHMPCRSVVFTGDSPRLTPLSFRQISGRAGRRNLDLRGHVFFFGVPIEKIGRLLNSSLSNLCGHEPHSTSFSLNLMQLHSPIQNLSVEGEEITKEEEKNLMDGSIAVLRNPFFEPSDEYKEQMLHQFRFYIQLLLKNGYMDDYADLHSASQVALQLGGSDPANFIALKLLGNGVLSRIVENAALNLDEKKSDVLKILGSLLNVRFMHGSVARHLKNQSPEKVENFYMLKRPNEEALSIISSFNKETFELFLEYLLEYFAEKNTEAEGILPLSSLGFERRKFGESQLLKYFQDSSCVSTLKSPIAGIDGKGDNFSCIEELIMSLREDCYVDSGSCPRVSTPHSFNCRCPGLEGNSYLQDYHKHLSHDQIIRNNGIDESFEWQLLSDCNDFNFTLSHVLKLGSSSPEDDKLISLIKEIQDRIHYALRPDALEKMKYYERKQKWYEERARARL